MYSKQQKLFEAETRLKKAIDRLDRYKDCGNVVRIEIPKIKHLL